MYRAIFSTRIKKAREMNGFTQKEVSKETGIKQSVISRYENGTIEPSLEKIGILAEFYGVSIDWLFGLGMQGRTPNYYTEEQKKVI